MSSTSELDSTYLIQSLGKGLDILELFMEHQELGTREIARLSGYNRSTVHRILVTFERHGYLVQNQPDGKFRLGMKFQKLGNLALRRFDLRASARPIMKALSQELNESVYLLVQVSEDSVVCIEEVQVHRTLPIGSTLGMSTPLHAGAAGKCFLAFDSPDTVKHFLTEHPLLPMTQHTITDPEAFVKQLETVRASGFALNDEESENGVRYVAVPIFDHNRTVMAALNVGAPVVRLPKDKIESIAVKMKTASTQISIQAGMATGREMPTP